MVTIKGDTGFEGTLIMPWIWLLHYVRNNVYCMGREICCLSNTDLGSNSISQIKCNNTAMHSGRNQLRLDVFTLQISEK